MQSITYKVRDISENIHRVKQTEKSFCVMLFESILHKDGRALFQIFYRNIYIECIPFSCAPMYEVGARTVLFPRVKL